MANSAESSGAISTLNRRGVADTLVRACRVCLGVASTSVGEYRGRRVVSGLARSLPFRELELASGCWVMYCSNGDLDVDA